MVDYETAATVQIWTLLRGISLLTSKFRIGNQIKFNDGVPWPPKATSAVGRQAGDYPEIKMRISRGQTPGLTGAGSQKTFGNTQAGGTTDFIVDESVTYELTLTYDGLDEVLPGQIKAAIKQSFFTAGSSLGLNKIKTWGPLDWRSEQKQVAGSLRLVQTITIPVMFHLHRADIVGT